MMLVCRSRFAALTSIVNHRILSLCNRYCSNSWPPIDKSQQEISYPSSSADDGNGSRNHVGGRYSFPMLCQDQPKLNSRELEVVDLDTWSISSGLACVSESKHKDSQLRQFGLEEVDDGLVNGKRVGDDLDFDEIEDMRIYGNLFYKIEKNSIEFEEYKYDFHGKKPKSNANDERESKKKASLKSDWAQNCKTSLKGKVSQQASSKNLSLEDDSLLSKERLITSIKERYIVCNPQDLDGSSAGKKRSGPTFNQLTGPYHEPFCLDIHVSKGSVCACVVHRVTSKVVVVAHSISKDMKFNLGSPKSRVAAATVGKVLAHRALADDIHDVIYSPRQGDKLEGKLQLVLQSIIDNGVNVKVKLKQRNPGKAVRIPTYKED